MAKLMLYDALDGEDIEEDVSDLMITCSSRVERVHSDYAGRFVVALPVPSAAERPFNCKLDLATIDLVRRALDVHVKRALGYAVNRSFEHAADRGKRADGMVTNHRYVVDDVVVTITQPCAFDVDKKWLRGWKVTHPDRTYVLRETGRINVAVERESVDGSADRTVLDISLAEYAVALVLWLWHGGFPGYQTTVAIDRDRGARRSADVTDPYDGEGYRFDGTLLSVDCGTIRLPTVEPANLLTGDGVTFGNARLCDIMGVLHHPEETRGTTRRACECVVTRKGATRTGRSRLAKLNARRLDSWE